LLHRAAVLARRSAARLDAFLCGDGGGVGAEADLCAALFGRDEGEYDAVIRLRRDALPNADCALRLAAQGGGSRLQVVPGLDEEALSDDKHSRAVLKGIPQGQIPVSISYSSSRETP
jgi:hypothetical protein